MALKLPSDDFGLGQLIPKMVKSNRTRFNWPFIELLLTSPEHIEKKCAAGLTDLLLADYQVALDHGSCKQDQLPRETCFPEREPVSSGIAGW